MIYSKYFQEHEAKIQKYVNVANLQNREKVVLAIAIGLVTGWILLLDSGICLSMALHLHFHLELHLEVHLDCDCDLLRLGFGWCL